MSNQVNDEVVKFSQSVRKELEELAKLGIHVPAGSLKRTEDMDEMEELQNMQVSECADLLISLG